MPRWFVNMLPFYISYDCLCVRCLIIHVYCKLISSLFSSSYVMLPWASSLLQEALTNNNKNCLLLSNIEHWLIYFCWTYCMVEKEKTSRLSYFTFVFDPNHSVYLVQANHQCSKGTATKKQWKQQIISAQLLEREDLELSVKLNSMMAL